MKKLIPCLSLFCIVLAGTAFGANANEGWPREMKTKLYTIVLYEPQFDRLEADSFEARAAVSVEKPGEEPLFGAVWLHGRVATDRDTRVVRFVEITVPTVAFPDISDEKKADLARFLEGEIPRWDLQMSLDAFIPLLDTAKVDQAGTRGLKSTPPKIIVTRTPAVLVLIDGEPRLKEIEGSSLKRVENTPFTIVGSGGSYYLLTDTLWYQAAKVTGPWKHVTSLPAEVGRVARELDEQRKKQAAQEKPADEPKVEPDPRIPEIVVSTVPAELIFIDGKTEMQAIKDTNILVVSNTDSDLAFDIDTQMYYALLAGRWYRTTSLDTGPWEWVANDQLPQVFASIPAGSDQGYLRTSIAGTDEAREAVLEQSIPQTAEVRRDDSSLKVEYAGQPKFESVETTSMKYAVNTSSSVILAGGRYYCCDEAVWYESSSPTGPWKVCTVVPPEIYTIPASCPVYNVTYVKVYRTTPQVVYVGYTPGYTCSYVSHGCVVYGTGWHYPPYYGPYYYPRPWTWGFSVRYNPWYGWSFGLSFSNGPFHLSFGFGGWGGGWWGPGRFRPYPVPFGMGYRAGYRRGYARGYYRGRHDANRRPAHYRGASPRRNIYARPGNAKRVVNTRDRRPVQRPSVARDRSNNIYADRKGGVHRRNKDGSWDQRTKGQWKPSTPSTRPATRPGTGGGTPARPATRPATRPSTRPATGPSTRPSTKPSTRPSTRPATRPATRPSTNTRPSTRSAPSSLQRSHSARQRSVQRSRPAPSRPVSRSSQGGARRR